MYSLSGQPQKLHFEVNENIELISIIQYLAGFYGEPLPSNYLCLVKKHFKKHDDHEAVQYLKKWFNEYHIGQDISFPDYGVYMTPFPEMKWKCTKDEGFVQEFEHAYSSDFSKLELFLVKARKFGLDSDFNSFYYSAKPMFKEMISESVKYHWMFLAETQSADKNASDIDRIITHFESFYKLQNVEWIVYLKPLSQVFAHSHSSMIYCAPNEYGFSISPERVPKFVSKLNKQQKNIKTPFTNKRYPPIFDLSAADLRYLIIHEGSHFITSEVYRSYKDSILNLGNLAEIMSSPIMQGEGYDDFLRSIDELLVRALSIRIGEIIIGPTFNSKKYLDGQVVKGYLMIHEVYSSILEQEKLGFSDYSELIQNLIVTLEDINDNNNLLLDLIRRYDKLKLVSKKNDVGWKEIYNKKKF